MTGTTESVTEATAVLAVAALPPPVTDYGMVRFEAMGHRYREGRLSEVMMAGQPFLRLDLDGGGIELYRPDAVYCIAPATTAVPMAEIPASFALELDDDEPEDDLWSSDGEEDDQ